ncbi:hypothetical protein P7K49_005913 [Saguinus oedipus]|uniref:Uncharacterized protein n=1 Tax=Saguinus oedipus TaxID=9490 RepID=A0ABQ9W0X0_SAGOE|nr:hypothetical protein P7K49_005913 [Saguinus oedipus]
MPVLPQDLVPAASLLATCPHGQLPPLPAGPLGVESVKCLPLGTLTRTGLHSALDAGCRCLMRPPRRPTQSRPCCRLGPGPSSTQLGKHITKDARGTSRTTPDSWGTPGSCATSLPGAACLPLPDVACLPLPELPEPAPWPLPSQEEALGVDTGAGEACLRALLTPEAPCPQSLTAAQALSGGACPVTPLGR